jgi:hypothetical protein
MTQYFAALAAPMAKYSNLRLPRVMAKLMPLLALASKPFPEQRPINSPLEPVTWEGGEVFGVCCRNPLVTGTIGRKLRGEEFACGQQRRRLRQRTRERSFERLQIREATGTSTCQRTGDWIARRA